MVRYGFLGAAGVCGGRGLASCALRAAAALAAAAAAGGVGLRGLLGQLRRHPGEHRAEGRAPYAALVPATGNDHERHVRHPGFAAAA